MALVAVKQGSLPALLFYLAIYALMDLGAFGVLGALSEPLHDLDELKDFQGIGYTHPWRSLVLVFCLLSLAGLPPAAGFLGKLILFWAVIRADFVILAVIGIITVIISIYYYFKVMVSMYLWTPLRELPVLREDHAAFLAAGIILLLLFWLGVFPTPLLSLIDRHINSPPLEEAVPLGVVRDLPWQPMPAGGALVVPGEPACTDLLVKLDLVVQRSARP